MELMFTDTVRADVGSEYDCTTDMLTALITVNHTPVPPMPVEASCQLHVSPRDARRLLTESKLSAQDTSLMTGTALSTKVHVHTGCDL